MAESRKVRIVCISDTHNNTPKLPKGDILIHAGDLTKQGTPVEIQRQMTWLERQEFQAKIVVAGNHDLALDEEFYAKHGARRHNQVENALEKAAELRGQIGRRLTYLCHEAACVRLQDGWTIKVFGSPYSRRRGQWAFGYGDDEGDGLWARLDEEKVDVVVSHGPAQGLCDADSHGQADGCAALLRALERARPRLVVCGHRHEGRGSVEIAWGSSGSHAVRRWRDPGRDGGRLSLVDLTQPGTERGAWADDGRLTTTGRAASGWEGPQASSGRSSTCVVNAAILAQSHGQAQRPHNRPMVVDVEVGGSGAEERGCATKTGAEKRRGECGA
jgi:Calcineurin-like phosphoesterase